MQRNKNSGHQLLIIGGGPAGLTAAIYAGRSHLKTLLLERELIGGQITYSPLLENYPGFPDGISGVDAGELMEKQARKYGVEIIMDEVSGLEVTPDTIRVQTPGAIYRTKSVIVAAGCRRVNLSVPGEKEFTGRGVFYCATCDAPLFRDKVVAVVGGGNSAITEALHMVKFAASVVVIHRRDQLRATKVLEERAQAAPKLRFLWDTVVKEVAGDNLVRRVTLENVKNGEVSTLDVGGVLVAIGQIPNTHFLKDILTLDDSGSIVVNDMMETNIPGIYAAGDIRHNSIRQVVSAAGDGATAAVAAERYISGLK